MRLNSRIDTAAGLGRPSYRSPSDVFGANNRDEDDTIGSTSSTTYRQPGDVLGSNRGYDDGDGGRNNRQTGLGRGELLILRQTRFGGAYAKSDRTANVLENAYDHADNAESLSEQSARERNRGNTAEADRLAAQARNEFDLANKLFELNAEDAQAIAAKIKALLPSPEQDAGVFSRNQGELSLRDRLNRLNAPQAHLAMTRARGLPRLRDIRGPGEPRDTSDASGGGQVDLSRLLRPEDPNWTPARARFRI